MKKYFIFSGHPKIGLTGLVDWLCERLGEDYAITIPSTGKAGRDRMVSIGRSEIGRQKKPDAEGLVLVLHYTTEMESADSAKKLIAEVIDVGYEAVVIHVEYSPTWSDDYEGHIDQIFRAIDRSGAEVHVIDSNSLDLQEIFNQILAEVSLLNWIIRREFQFKKKVPVVQKLPDPPEGSYDPHRFETSGKSGLRRKTRKRSPANQPSLTKGSDAEAITAAATETA